MKRGICNLVVTMQTSLVADCSGAFTDACPSFPYEKMKYLYVKLYICNIYCQLSLLTIPLSWLWWGRPPVPRKSAPFGVWETCQGSSNPGSAFCGSCQFTSNCFQMMTPHCISSTSEIKHFIPSSPCPSPLEWVISPMSYLMWPSVDGIIAVWARPDKGCPRQF